MKIPPAYSAAADKQQSAFNAALVSEFLWHSLNGADKTAG